MKRYDRVFLFIVFLCLAMLSISIAGEVIDGEYWSDEALEKRQALREIIENPPPQVTPDTFTGYGRVVDQYGDPVANAKVEVHWKRFQIVKGVGIKMLVDENWVATNQDGYFIATTTNGAIPTFWRVEAKGYESQLDISPYRQKSLDGRKTMMKNSENEPIILYMRKLNPTTFLLKSETGYYFKESIEILRYTMIPGLMRKIDSDLSKLKKPEQNDLIFTVNKNEDGSYTMKIQPIPEIGGTMQILDNFLYEAPADGYGQEATLTIRSEDGDIKKYLYFTSRKTPVYSRMTMELHIRDDGELSFSNTTWTNPYGKRNLEWEPELPIDLFIMLRNEAEKALKNGNLPPEPEDLQALIDQYSEK